MTRKEAIANLNMISVAFVEPVTKEQRTLINDTFDMAISALSAIEDIKTEIVKRVDEYLPSSSYDGDLYNGAYKDGLCDALYIIDKHIEEIK